MNHRSTILLASSWSFNKSFYFLTTHCHTEGKNISVFHPWSCRFQTVTPHTQNVTLVSSLCTDTLCANNFMLVKLLSVNPFTLTKGCPYFFFSLTITVPYPRTLQAKNVKQIWHSEDRASQYILIIKLTRSTNFSNLFLQ